MFLKDFKEYGFSKVLLVWMVLVILVPISVYILGGFVNLFEGLCDTFTPFYPCENTDALFGGWGATLIAIFGPLFIYRSLLRWSYLAIIGTMGVLFLALFLGTFVLKYLHVQRLNSTQ